jgi:hypothetical protein
VSAIQNKIIKIITPDHKKHCLDSISNYFIFSQILPVELLYLYRFILKYYFSNAHKNKYIHGKNTRQQLMTRYIVPLVCNKHGQRHPSWQIPTVFNDVPQEVLSLDKFTNIKNAIRNWLFAEKL